MRYAKTSLLLGAAFLASMTACRKTDFTESVVPVVATSLSLLTQQRADSAFVDITLGGGAPSVLGSLTGDVVHPASWRFAGCEASQPGALLACKEHDATVRVAAAWAAGTHAGELVRLTYVRRAPDAAPAEFTMSITEAHGVRGESLTDVMEIRKQSVVRTNGSVTP